ncbi:MAG TPA: YbdK family carboxylate-amine ligase [Longimicrobiaceae bacterium]|jgi:carboxylate-amine ligase|nr:YbdK family carboxylate-amine ligase [Longimicrobiaceae bacterium]
MPRPEDFTLGVEEEYQLVDAATGELRSRARYVIAADWADEIKPEMQEHTVEVETGVCRGSNCVRDDLARLRFTAAVAAESEGLRVVAAGTHPFSAASGHSFTDAPVYRRIRDEYRQLAESQSIFGMHVHVGVPAGVDRVRVMNVARLYLPFVLALTASSPFFTGEDTGYASFRSLLWRRWPRTGAPPRFEDEAEMAEMVRWLMATERIDAPGRIYWEMRPHHVYPTIEWRAADVTPRLDDAIAAAALARAVVAGVVEGLLAEPPLPANLLSTLLAENSWRVSRDATAALLVDLDRAEPATITASDALLRLSERLEPVAAALGDAGALAAIPELLERGGAAARIRARAAELDGDLAALTLWMADETVLGAGLDRRGEQRMEEDG